MTADNELRPASQAWQDYQKRRAARNKSLDAFIALDIAALEAQITKLRGYQARRIVKWRQRLKRDEARDWKRYLEERAAEKAQEVT